MTGDILDAIKGMTPAQASIANAAIAEVEAEVRKVFVCSKLMYISFGIL